MLDRHIITGFNKGEQQLAMLANSLIMHQLKASVIEEVLRGAGILTEEAFNAAKDRLANRGKNEETKTS